MKLFVTMLFLYQILQVSGGWLEWKCASYDYSPFPLTHIIFITFFPPIQPTRTVLYKCYKTYCDSPGTPNSLSAKGQQFMPLQEEPFKNITQLSPKTVMTTITGLKLLLLYIPMYSESFGIYKGLSRLLPLEYSHNNHFIVIISFYKLL